MVLAVIGVLWIACGLASWWVAKHRGLPHPDRYFFLGFFFGVIGLAVVTFNPASWLGKKDSRLQTVNCPNCKATNPIDATFCEECGGEISWPPLTSRLDNWRSKHPA